MAKPALNSCTSPAKHFEVVTVNCPQEWLDELIYRLELLRCDAIDLTYHLPPTLNAPAFE